MKKQYSDEGLIILESALYRTTTSIIIGLDYIVLIDPNSLASEIDYIDAVIKKHRASKKVYLIFTHSDYDHIIGSGKFEAAESIASSAFVGNPNKEKIIDSIKAFDDEYYISRDYEIVYPAISIEIKEAVQEMKIAGDNYVFYQTPGHTNDSLTIYNKSKGILIVGDYLSNIEFPFIYDSRKAYQETLAMFSEIIDTEDVKILIVGHGDYTKNRDEMKHRIERSKKYIDEITAAILDHRVYDIDRFLQQYEYRLGLKKSHDGNVALIKKELGR